MNNKIKIYILLIIIIFVVLETTPIMLGKIYKVPHPIYGFAQYFDNGYADGAKVYVNASSIGKQKITWVGPSGGWLTGFWQVDVGDPNTWPINTPFTVDIIGQDTYIGWKGSISGLVSGYGNNMGTTIINPSIFMVDAGGPYNGIVNESIQFTGNVVNGIPPYTYFWNFGDESISTEQNPIHTFTNTGIYDVILTVKDSENQQATDNSIATISSTSITQDLECEGSLSWIDIKQVTTVNGTFIVRNKGENGSKLDWVIFSYPDWGLWTFTPSEGLDLTPEDGDKTIEVSLIAPKVKNIPLNLLIDKETEFFGDIRVVNNDNLDDYCDIPVYISILKNKEINIFKIFEQQIQYYFLIKVIKVLKIFV